MIFGGENRAKMTIKGQFYEMANVVLPHCSNGNCSKETLNVPKTIVPRDTVPRDTVPRATLFQGEFFIVGPEIFWD